MADVLAPLPARAPGLFAEYLAAATPEARLVKACDKLQLMLKVAVYERWGESGLAEFWDNPDNFPDSGSSPPSPRSSPRSGRGAIDLWG